MIIGGTDVVIPLGKLSKEDARALVDRYFAEKHPEARHNPDVGDPGMYEEFWVFTPGDGRDDLGRYIHILYGTTEVTVVHGHQSTDDAALASEIVDLFRRER